MEVTTKRVLLYKEAKEIVNKINTHINDVRALILELYEGEGWTSLGYENWRECVTAEFKLEQSHVYRLLDAAQIEKNISPMGEKVIPERQLRPLMKFKDNPEKQREAWAKAVETAPGGKVTAAHVAKVVKEITGGNQPAIPAVPAIPAPEEKKEDGREVPDLKHRPKKKRDFTPGKAAYFIAMVISQLERVRDDDPDREEEFDILIDWINKNKNKKTKEGRYIPEHAVYFVTIAISQLERIKPDDPSREKAFSMLKEWIRKNR